MIVDHRGVFFLFLFFDGFFLIVLLFLRFSAVGPNDRRSLRHTHSVSFCFLFLRIAANNRDTFR